MPLNREQFLAKVRETYKTIHLDSLDGDILIRKWPAKELIELTDKVNNGEISQLEFNYSIVCASLIDEETGVELLTMEMLEKLPREIITELIQAVNEVNSISLDKAKENLKKIQKEGSSIN